MKKRDKSLELNKYGIFHLGMKEGETFDLSFDDFISGTGTRSGTAYTVVNNKFTEKMKSFGFVKGKGGASTIAGKSVPVRDWLRFDQSLLKNLIKDFKDSLVKNFKKT